MARNPAVENPEPAEEPAKTDDNESKFEPYVEWRGSAGYREITDDQWKDAGVHDQNTVSWTRGSHVLLSDLSEDAVARLAGEPDFFFVHEEND